MEHIDFRDQIAKNKRNSFFLVLFVLIILIAFGYVIALAFGEGYFYFILILAIIFSVSYTWISYYNSHKIAIAAVGAKEASTANYPDYHRLVEGLTIASGLPKPKLYVMNSPQINAFASGRDPAHAVVCVTTGAMEKLNRRELEAVLSHELSHIANYDIRFITLVSVMVGMIAIISEIFLRSLWFKNGDNKNSGIFIIIGIAFAILAPIVVMLVQLAVSRKREFAADASAVQFTRNPDALISALEKIKTDHAPKEKISKAVAPLFFSNPLKGLGSTHPPIEKRIEVLRHM